MGDSYVCSICGKTHEGLLTDFGYKLPDDVWAIPEGERASRAKFTVDLCQLGNRFFIRCVLRLPFTARAGDFGWGVWIEVSQTVFDRYLALFQADARDEQPFAGTIANRLPDYAASLGLPVLVQFGEPTERPSVHFGPDDGA